MTETAVLGDHEHDDENEGAYRNDLMLADANNDEAVQAAADLGLTRVEHNEIAGMLSSSEPDQTEQDLATAAAGLLLESVSVFRVPPGGAVRVLETESEGKLLRVRAFRAATHSGRSEALPKKMAAGQFAGKTQPLNDAHVAVIDSGLPSGWEALPPELGAEVRLSPAWPGLDTEGGGLWEQHTIADRRGHGLFVAFLISRLCGAKVTVAKMGIIDPKLVTDEEANSMVRDRDELVKVAAWWDEIQVFYAVVKLILRRPPVSYAALNMSFGSFVETEKELGSAGKAVRAGTELWQKEFPDAPMFAAAGNIVPGTHHHANHDDHGATIPAALDDVVGVGSSDSPGGLLSDFSDPRFQWIATGRDAIGISDVTGRKTVWSGTSFSCAVATAAYILDSALDTGGVQIIDLDPRN